MNEGDYELAGQVQRNIAKAESDIARLKEGKAAIESAKKQPVTRQEPIQAPQQQAPQTQWDRIEAYITQPAHSLRAQQYMRDHYDDLFNDFDSGAKRLNKLLGGHYIAKSEGVAENTDSYYDRLSEHMGYTQPVQRQEPVQQAPAKPRSNVPPAAPVSRGGQNSGNGSSTSVTLTPAQVAFCRDSGIEPKVYAKMLLTAKAGGKDPAYTGPRFTSDLD